MKRCVLLGSAGLAGLMLAAAAAGGTGSPPASRPASQPASAPPGPNHLDTEKRISFNFASASVDQVFAYLSRVAGITFLRETAVSGDVSIVNQQELTVADALNVLNSVLKVKGATLVVNETRMVKVVPLAEAKRREIEVLIGNDPEGVKPGDTMITQVVPLQRAGARDLVRDLKNLVGTYGEMLPAVHANCLIITDTASNVRRLLLIIKEADTDPEQRALIRVFTLRYADARKVQDIVKQLLMGTTGAGRTSGGGSTATRVIMGGFGGGPPRIEGGGGGSEGGGAADSSVPTNVTIDERLNALIVIAGTNQMAVIARLVEQLDVPPPTARVVVEVVTLEHGDATEIAKTVNEVFKGQTSTASARSSGGGGRSAVAAFWEGRLGIRPTTPGAAEETVAPVTEELTVSADRRTNQIILVGTREQVDLAKQLIEQLSKAPGDQMEMMIYPLKNAKAKDLETGLRQVLREATQAAQRLVSGTTTTGGRGAQAAQDAAAEGIAGETIVVADVQANALIIVSNPRNFPRLREHIAALDQAKPQVFIKAMIGEITLDDDTKLGLDITHTDASFRHGAGSAVWAMDFGVAGDLTGGSVSINYRDIELVIRALETEGKLHVLSRPHILTRDNMPARIADAERVPFIQNTRTTDVGSVFNTITYEDIGIILEVTPQINPEGYVNLTVRQEISRVTGKTVPISEGVDAPTFSTRSAETTVAIRDRQTIVIGGLISESEVKTIDQVPILGKIPIIKYAFRSSVVTKQRKELILIITPYVVRTDQELQAVSDLRRRGSAFKDAREECPAGTEPLDKPCPPLSTTRPVDGRDID